MRIPGIRILRLAPEEGIVGNIGERGGYGTKWTLLRRWNKKSAVEETRVESGEIAIHVVPAIDELTVTVTGRVSVDSSPHLRTLLLNLLHRVAAPVMVIDLSDVSYVDMSGIATLLEALKAAQERSLTLRVVGIRGQVRMLAETAHLDAIFRSLGSEVEFC
jgi:anti-sigma B factor antagonist